MLTGRDNGDYIFAYDAGWLGSRAPIPLSLSLPLQREPFTPELAQAFFANLLPEGQLRDHFAGKYRVSADDDFALLAAAVERHLGLAEHLAERHLEAALRLEPALQRELVLEASHADDDHDHPHVLAWRAAARRAARALDA